MSWNRSGLVCLALCVMVSTAGAQEVRAPADASAGTYRSDRLGIEYRLQPYRGHFAAVLTRDAGANSSLRNIVRADGSVTYLEAGDMIVTLDSQVIDGPADVENHVQLTRVEFVNSRTGGVEVANARFPDDNPNGGGGGGGGGGGNGGGPVVRPESRRVRAILVGDTLSNLAGLDQDLDRVRGLLRPLVDEGRCEVTTLTGNRANAGTLVNTIRALGDCRDDTVVVYYTGHGATDPNRGHALTFTQGGALFRTSLRAELARLSPRLTVVLSDCCSNVVVLPPEVGAPAAPDPRPVIRSLFLRTSGVVDINASLYDPARGIAESAWCERGGGLFTAALFDTIFLSGLDRLDADRNGLVTWSEAFPPLRAATANAYGRFRNRALNEGRLPGNVANALNRQASQTPQAFSLDGGLVPAGGVMPRREMGVTLSGITVIDPATGQGFFGARLDTIRPGAPAALARLEPGDILTAVNGRRFRSLPEVSQLLSQGNNPARVQIRNVRGGALIDVDLTFPD